MFLVIALSRLGHPSIDPIIYLTDGGTLPRGPLAMSYIINVE